MRKYDSYKDSGVEWIGEIPKHWKRYRIQYLLSMSSAGVWGEEAKGDENDIICFRMADFDYEHGCLKLDNLTLRNITPYQLKGREFHRGDLMLEKSGGGDVYPVGRVVRVNTDLKSTCSNFAHAMATKNDVSSDFLYYYFFSLYVRKINMLFFNQTTGIQNLKVSEYLGQTIYLPNYAEQQAIASYLDRKTSEIDKLMAEREKRIKLLEELKASVISHAVTKGLDPNAKMKPSGVEWIGDIPEGWEVEKLNYVCKVITDYVASGSFADLRNNVTYLDNPDYAMLVRTADLSNKGTISKVYINKHSYDFLSNSNLFGGEIILPNIGASIGDVYIIPNYLYERMSLAPNSIMLKTKYCNNFYYYWFKGNRASKELKLMGGAAAQGKFNKTELRRMKTVVPPLAEQKKIISFLDEKNTSIEKSINTQRREISLLRDYKQSLITEVVTGKRKVV